MDLRLLGIAALATCAFFTSCSSDDDPEPTPPPGEAAAGSAYVVIGTASDMGSTSSYVLTTGSLNEGEISTVNNGYATAYSSATTWLFYGNEYVYSLSYNYGDAAGTSAFYLDGNGNIQKRPKQNNILNFTSYGIYGNKIIMADASSATDTEDAHGNKAYGTFFSIIDVDDESTDIKTLITEDFLGTHEYVTLCGLLEANGKIYTAIVPRGCSPYGVAAGGVLPGNEDLIKNSSGGVGGGMYTAGTLDGTQYPNECNIAVFDDATFSSHKIIKTNKLSWAAGRMRSAYYQTIWAADNGDIYVFSPSYAKSQADPRQQTTINSGVMRIKKGAEEFDSSYPMFDIEAASGGQAVYRCWHITGDYFLLQMYTKGITARGEGTTRLAIYKGEDRTFNYVTGLPDPEHVSSFSKEPYKENGVCYTAVVTDDGAKPTIYKIDPKTATATPGLQVQANSVVGIGMLKSK